MVQVDLARPANDNVMPIHVAQDSAEHVFKIMLDRALNDIGFDERFQGEPSSRELFLRFPRAEQQSMHGALDLACELASPLDKNRIKNLQSSVLSAINNRLTVLQG